MSSSNLFLKFGKFLVLYLGCVCMTFNFTTERILRHLLLMPINKKLSAKTTKYILKCWERSVKRKSNLSFIRVIKNSSFDQRFLYLYGYNFSENSLVTISCSTLRTSPGSSATLLCKTQNTLTLSMLVYYKGASTKNFRHACVFWPLRGWGVGLGESIKKEKFVTKIFF